MPRNFLEQKAQERERHAWDLPSRAPTATAAAPSLLPLRRCLAAIAALLLPSTFTVWLPNWSLAVAQIDAEEPPSHAAPCSAWGRAILAWPSHYESRFFAPSLPGANTKSPWVLAPSTNLNSCCSRARIEEPCHPLLLLTEQLPCPSIIIEPDSAAAVPIDSP